MMRERYSYIARDGSGFFLSQWHRAKSVMEAKEIERMEILLKFYSAYVKSENGKCRSRKKRKNEKKRKNK